jgi:hypothetical protein
LIRFRGKENNQMLHLFTQLLKDYLVQQGIAPADRITLGPPDQKFVGTLQLGQYVNVYLADLRENRKLRRIEFKRDQPPNGLPERIHESLYPAWVDAHYLITAWDTSGDQSAKALAEHKILAAVSSVLLAGDPFTPREVYPDPTDADLAPIETARAAARAAAQAAGATLDQIVAAGDQAAAAARKLITDRILAPLNAWPEEFRLPGLPYEVLPPEGFHRLSDFWTNMGTGSLWKPVVWLVAAVPVELKPQFDYPIVTTMKTTIGQTADAPSQTLIRAIDKDGFRSGTDHEWYQIGGFVSKLDGPRPLVPVKGARMTLQTAGDPTAIPPVAPTPLQETRTDDGGKYQFLFAGPLAGQLRRFQVIAQARGLKADPLNVVLTPAEPFPHNVVMQPV